MKKIIASTLVAAAALVGFAGGASAHTPKVSHDCTEKGATLTVHLVQYEKGSTVLVNGVTSVFGQAEYKTTTTIGDGTKPVTWTVRVTNGAEYTPKTDKYDQEFTDVVKACVLTDIDLTPPTTVPAVTVPPHVEYIHPATPPCVLDGRFDANTPECEAAGTPVVVLNPPEVLERAPQPPVLAFTGSTATTRAIQGAAIFAIGLSLLYIGRRFGKVV